MTEPTRLTLILFVAPGQKQDGQWLGIAKHVHTVQYLARKAPSTFGDWPEPEIREAYVTLMKPPGWRIFLRMLVDRSLPDFRDLPDGYVLPGHVVGNPDYYAAWPLDWAPRR
jgi:hypothetical protein